MRTWTRLARRRVAAGAAGLVALSVIAAPGGADHLGPQIVETNDPQVVTVGSVGTEPSCPGGWSGGSAQYLGETGHLTWTFTVPEGHTGVVSMIGYRDPALARPFLFWVDPDPMATIPNEAGSQECRAVLASSDTLPAGTYTVHAAGTPSPAYPYLDHFELVTGSITGDLVITKISDTAGTFDFTVDCPGTGVADHAVRVDVAAAGPPGATATVAGIPVNTTCTVTEATAPGFSPQAPQDVTIAEGANGVTFTNVRETGSLVVSATTDGGTGTFAFTVDCNPGTAFDSAFELAGGQTRRIDGIPTLSTCTVTEASDPLYTSVATPADGTVTIATGDNPVSFVNTARPPALGITKTADAASVTAGAAVGFTVAVANTGAGPATGVTLSDPLPPAAGVSWAVSPAYAGPGTCTVTGAAPTQTLACTIGDLAPGATASVHVSSTTSSAATLSNTATAQAANASPVSASATVTVLAPVTGTTGAADTTGTLATTTTTTTPTTVRATVATTVPTTAPATAVAGTGTISTVSTGAATGVTPGRATAATAGSGLARTGRDLVRLALAGAAMVAAGLLVLLAAGRPAALRPLRRP